MDSPAPPTLYKRKYATGGEVSPEDLRTAYEVAARLVGEHGDQYLPLFQRLDQEVQHQREKETLKNRALAVASQGTLKHGPQ